ncbi:hypothetical protein Holit_00407 [Hollandina sp. SP2]
MASVIKFPKSHHPLIASSTRGQIPVPPDAGSGLDSATMLRIPHPLNVRGFGDPLYCGIVRFIRGSGGQKAVDPNRRRLFLTNLPAPAAIFGINRLNPAPCRESCHGAAIRGLLEEGL